MSLTLRIPATKPRRIADDVRTTRIRTGTVLELGGGEHALLLWHEPKGLLLLLPLRECIDTGSQYALCVSGQTREVTPETTYVADMGFIRIATEADPHE